MPRMNPVQKEEPTVKATLSPKSFPENISVSSECRC